MDQTLQSIGHEKLTELRAYDKPERMEWMKEYIKANPLSVVLARGHVKKLSTIFDKHRHTIGDEMQKVMHSMKPADLDRIELDLRHAVESGVVKSRLKFEDENLDHIDRQRYGMVMLRAAQDLIKVLEKFGKKERDMMPPAPVEERKQDSELDVMALDFAKEWRAKHVSKKPQGVE